MKSNMNKDISTMLVTEEDILARVSEIGAKITQDYKEKNLVLIAVLRGAYMFLSDLTKKITIPLEVDFISVSTYGNMTTSSGEIIIRSDVTTNLNGKDVIIVEDILDTGLTLDFLISHLNSKGANSVETCVFLDKVNSHKIEITPTYKCFDIPQEFVVGYGLDYAEKYRNLPFVGILRKEIYS